MWKCELTHIHLLWCWWSFLMAKTGRKHAKTAIFGGAEWKKHKKCKKRDFPQQIWPKIEIWPVPYGYIQNPRAGKWGFRGAKKLKKRGVYRRNAINEGRFAFIVLKDWSSMTVVEIRNLLRTRDRELMMFSRCSVRAPCWPDSMIHCFSQ